MAVVLNLPEPERRLNVLSQKDEVLLLAEGECCFDIDRVEPGDCQSRMQSAAEGDLSDEDVLRGERPDIGDKVGSAIARRSLKNLESCRP
jgi:hypothetical protein